LKQWRRLPDGFDPNALAAEAITEFLQNSVQHEELLRLPITDIQRNLERRVRRHINRLHHRSENRLIRNEPDIILSPWTMAKPSWTPNHPRKEIW